MLVLADWGWATPSTLGAAQIKIITQIQLVWGLIPKQALF